MAIQKLPRGLRNNNPLNLIISNNEWLGKIHPNTDGRFEQFISIDYGIRAAMMTLRSYIRKGFNTPKAIITRWAPPTENNTAAYIDRATRIADLAPNQILTSTSRNAICRLLWAMTQVENGRLIPIDNFFKVYDTFLPKINE